MSNSPFLTSISQDMRQRYSLRTEKTYIHWIKWFILFHGKRHPNTMAGEEVRRFYRIWRMMRMYLPTRKNRASMRWRFV